jgi:hypothetical protein
MLESAILDGVRVLRGGWEYSELGQPSAGKDCAKHQGETGLWSLLAGVAVLHLGHHGVSMVEKMVQG